MKLIMSDIDGVLIGHEIPTNEILEALKEKIFEGERVSLVTGRGFLRVVDFVQQLQPNAPIVVEDGGRVIDVDGRHIISHYIDDYSLELLRPILSSPTLEFACFALSDNKWYSFFCRDSEIAIKVKKKYPFCGSITFDAWEFINGARGKSAKISIVASDSEAIDFPEGICKSSNEGIINVNPVGVNKGTGILFLSQYLNITMKDIVVIGNEDNDIPMFKLPVGIKIAVKGKNLPIELINEASFLIDPRDLPDIIRKI